ncbi:hypothetical protein [Paenibacillus sanguinis]|uniref:hypothetical protein n=1 Tax=Paenibacillus sanguinis TaxID=225906 RepID=UPI00036F86D4|nr:hypothetical protein [Paenibacillus sanguinis]
MLKGTAYLTIIAALMLSVACSSSDSDTISPPTPPTIGKNNAEQAPVWNSNQTTEDMEPQPALDDTPKHDDDPKQDHSGEMDGTAGQLYAIAFEAMMKIEKTLNNDMKYIAIDLSKMTQLTAEDKSYIMEYLQTFDTVIRDRTLEQLKLEESNKNAPLLLSGVFLRVDKVDIGVASALIEGAKYRSDTGSLGVKVSLEFVDGVWKLSGSDINWES